MKCFEELLHVANRTDLVETGGAHNQKGIEFQRHWAVAKLLDLVDGTKHDKQFLMLINNAYPALGTSDYGR